MLAKVPAKRADGKTSFKSLAKYACEREHIDPETGARLLYRVHPIMADNSPSNNHMRMYRTHEPANQLAQMQLYRWCRSPDFIQAVSCRELYDYLIADPMKDSKRNLRRLQFGQTLLRFLLQKPQQQMFKPP